MRKQGTWVAMLSAMITDAILAATAFVCAYYLRLATDIIPAVDVPPLETYYGPLLIQVGSIALVFFFSRLYHVKRGISLIDLAYRIFVAVSVGTAIATALTAFTVKGLEIVYPRLMLAYVWLLSITFLVAGRVIITVILGSLRARGRMKEPMIIVGATDIGRLVLSKVQQSPHLGYRVVGFVDDHAAGPTFEGLPLLGQIADLGDIVTEGQIAEVIIALPQATRREILGIVSSCSDKNVSVRVYPDLFQIMATEVSIGDLNGLPLVSIRDVALRGWRLTLKRAVDMVFSAAVLIMFAPAFLFLALLVKLESRGPALYIQERVGLDGKPFPAVKYRSMRQDAEKETGPVWATADDPRRTRMGTFLRRFSLDEVPQFINVLMGQMSVVGPRPERPVFVEEFSQRVPRYMERHREKAGITGWAQVNGLRGDVPIEDRTAYDIWYVENWTLGLDFKIMLKTLYEMIRGENAY
ncbi:MAG: undecaprenyl-phosphate glucose phosphotransferase [Chloroflexi bacterium]|nr:undecaprenyl-phosphate glucose phosphotransferase [Chloroflexota bacterium]MBU1750266.1 undecaprenyl-phosphate glucose phosphotransferase [Chloroflexota bacterium]MBU1877835.1 undecaprenyl-phosphate glucose phosphotransferase [Chloroflexota bacterium]